MPADRVFVHPGVFCSLLPAGSGLSKNIPKSLRILRKAGFVAAMFEA